jgi:hypothetical protein
LQLIFSLNSKKTNMKIFFKAFAILAIFFIFQPKVNAAVYTWIGANNENFYTPSNFSPSRNISTVTDTIIITSGLGGDTIVANAIYVSNPNYYFFQMGTLRITNGRKVTLHCKSNTNSYTSCFAINGVGGISLQVDTNCELNVYGNGNLWIPGFYAFFDVGNQSNASEAIINGKLPVNSITAKKGAFEPYQNSLTVHFQKCLVTINGTFEILSDQINLTNYPNKIYFHRTSSLRSKVVLNGDFIYTGGRGNADFRDSILQVQPSGRVILNFPANATEHSLKGIFLPGSQVVINGHPGSDTALITLPDSISNLVVNTNGNSRPLHFIARSNYTNSLVPVLIKGNVTINNTGSSYVEFNHPDSNRTATIEGNLTLNGGGLQIRNYSNNANDLGSRLYVKGNYLQNGGTLNFIGAHPKVGQLFVGGNFFQYGGLVKNTSGSLYPQIVFNGNTAQTLRLRSNVDDSITFVFNNAAGFVLDSNLVVGTGSTVNYISGAFSGAGSVVYSSPNSTLMFANTVATTPSSYLWSNTLVPFNVTLNNTAPITLPGSRLISRSLTVGQGVLDIATTDSLTIGNSSNPAVVVQTGTGRIRGKMSLWIGAGNGVFLFPVGSNSKLKTIQVQYTNAPTLGGTLSGSYVSALPGNSGLPLIQGTDSIFKTIDDGYWKISSGNGLNGGTYTVKAFGNNVTGVSQYQKLALLKRVNSTSPWTIPGVHVAPVGKNDSFYVSRSGLTGFSDFAIAESSTQTSNPNIGNNTIGSDQTICAGSSPISLAGSVPTNGNGIFTYLWIQATAAATGPYTAAVGLNTNQNYAPPILNGSVWYRRLVYSGTALDTSNFIFINVLPKLKVGFTINKQIQCLNGNQFIFTDTTVGNTNRLWKYGNGDTSTSASLVISFPASVENSYPIKLYGSIAGNCMDSFANTVYIVNNPVTKPIIGDSVIDYFSTVVYQVPARNGSTYSWYFNNGLGNSTSNSIQIKWTTVGVDQIKLVELANNGCKGDTVYKDITINKVNGIDDNLGDRNIHLYPNPNNGRFTMSYKGNDLKEIKAFDVFGKVVLSQKFEIGNTEMDVDLSAFSEGIYFMDFTFGDDVKVMKKIYIKKD